MDYIIIIGFIAAVCTSSTFLPQILKSYKSKSTKDVSLGMVLLMILGVSLWLVYAISRRDVVVFTAQVIAMFFSIFLLILKLKYK